MARLLLGAVEQPGAKVTEPLARPVCGFSVKSRCLCLGIRVPFGMGVSNVAVLPGDAERCASAGVTASKDSAR